MGAPSYASSSVTLRSDIYITRNTCGQETKSQHEVLIAEFDLEEMDNSSSYEFQFTDSESKFKQTVVFKDQVFHYGPIFGEGNHLEYNLPECDSHGCRVFIFIYKRDIQLNKTIGLQLTVRKKSSKDPRTVKFIFPKIQNQFSELSSLPQVELQPIYDKKNQLLKVSLRAEDLQKLRKHQVQSFELIAAVRTALKQKAYTEKSNSFDLLKSANVSLQYPVANPTYLSVMALYKINKFSFESKTVIMDLNSTFFKCVK